MDRQSNKRTDKQIVARQTDRLTDKQKDEHTDRQIGGLTNIGGQTDR